MSLNNYLADSIKLFADYKSLAEKAIEQVDDNGIFRKLDDQSNSIAIIVKHMAGNMRSRWTDFLTSDGEKPDRNRDYEFILVDGDGRESLMKSWENGWRILFEALESLTADDLNRTVLIRSEPHTVIEAVNRQLTHYAYHVGQVVYMARHFAGASWRSLSVPRGKSDEFNEMMRRRSKERQS